MKNLKFIFFVIVAFCWSISNSQDILYQEENGNSQNISGQNDELETQSIILCLGEYAYAYHYRSNCPGLNNCKGEIRTSSSTQGRKPCCICVSKYNCAEDGKKYAGGSSSNGGGDGNSDAYAYMAVAIVALSAAVLSNDFYVYPTYSFIGSTDSYYGKNKGYGVGYTFGFRKTFNYSALELGASHINYKTKITSSFSNYLGNFVEDTYESSNKRWSYHFNYVHDIFYRTPNWYRLYIGPTFIMSSNYDFYGESTYSYGVLIGAKTDIANRLKFDIRYEYTSETNQIRAGLIYNYQRKYFWQKRK